MKIQLAKQPKYWNLLYDITTYFLTHIHHSSSSTLASVRAIVSCMYTLFRIASLLCLICFPRRLGLYLLFMALYFHSSKSKQISEDFGKTSSQPFHSFDRTIDPKMLNKRKMTLFTRVSLLCLISKQYYCDKEKRKFEPHTRQIMHVRTQILCDITSLLNLAFAAP